MTWPEAIYKILVEGGGGLLTAIFLLCWFTDFFEIVFSGTKTRVIEVVPEELKDTLTEVIVEMRGSAREGKHNSTMLADWAKRISEALEDEEDS